MVDSLRGGGFGSPGSFGPFRTNQGGFSQYAIGGTQEDTAYLDKLEAQIAWQNGRLGDDAYVGALRAYVNATEEGTTSHASAVDDLNDTIHSISRNKAIDRVNRAASPSQTIHALLALQRLDRRRLRTMQPGNEAFREQQAIVADVSVQIRSVRWGQVTSRFNNGRMSLAELRGHAASFAREARGAPDQQQFLDQVMQLEGQILDQELGDALDAWQDDPGRGTAARVRSLYSRARGRVSADSPEGRRLAEAEEDFAQAVKAHDDELDYVRMQSKHDRGTVSDERWLDFLRRRVGDAPRGSGERIRRRDSFLNESFNVAQRDLVSAVEAGKRTTGDLIDFYRSSMATMDLDSARALELQAHIADLRSSGIEALAIAQGGQGGGTGEWMGGHLVQPRMVAGGDGFVSQFDGSTFASTNCGMAATAMLAWAVSGGKVRVTGGQMRAYSGDREGGTWVDDMVRGLSALGIGGRQYQGIGFGSFRQKIKSGQPAVLTGTSGMLPDQYNVGTFQGAHSVFVSHMTVKDGQVWYWVMDPLGRAGYDGMWWPEQVVQAYGWKGAVGTAGASAVFAGKAGSARNVSGKLPPFQAFDTDYLGRSTIGAGGGSNREEAGPRKDWSRGKPVRPKPEKDRKGTDDAMVSDFLEVVHKLQGSAGERTFPDDQPLAAGVEPRSEQFPETGRVEERAARAMLEKYEGDPRRAAIEWMTGQDATDLDPANWTQRDRWIANNVGRRFGYERLKRGKVVQTGAPDQPAVGQDIASLPGPPGYDPLDSIQAPTQGTGINPGLDSMARGILERLGIVPNAQQVRMVASWISAENGGREVQGYNPLGLTTDSETALPDQIGKLEDGRANFDTLEAGLDAAADAIRTDEPGLVGALRSGSPETFVRALGDAGWSERDDYASSVGNAFNTLPGAERIIANTSPQVFTAPTSLGSAVKTTPELSDLLDVDPTDPVQMAWFQGNAQRAFNAASAGMETWDYELPTGETIKVPTAGGAVKDILAVDYAYTTAQQGRVPTPAGWDAIDKAKQRFDAQTTEIDFEMTERHIETAWRARDAAMSSGDWLAVHNIEQGVAMSINFITGAGPLATPGRDINNPNLTKPQLEAVERWSEMVEPYDPNTASSGSLVGAMVRDGVMRPEYKPVPAYVASIGGGSALADRMTMTGDVIVTQNADGTVTPFWEANAPDLFAPTPEMGRGPNGEMIPTGIEVPFYRSADSGYVHVTADGLDLWQQSVPSDAPVVVYARKFEGADGEVIAQQQSAARAQDQGGFVIPFMGMGPGINTGAMGGELRIGGGGAAAPATTRPVDPANGSVHAMGALDATQVPHFEFSYIDPESGEKVTWYSLDRVEWIGRVGTELGGKPPGLVITPGAAEVRFEDGLTPHIYVGPELFDPKKHDVGSIFHWFGTQDADTLGSSAHADSMGSPDGDYIHRRISVVGDPSRPEGLQFDGTLSIEDRYRSNLIGQAEATVRARRQDQAIRGAVRQIEITAAAADAHVKDQVMQRRFGIEIDKFGAPLTGWGRAMGGVADPRIVAGVTAQARSAEQERQTALTSLAQAAEARMAAAQAAREARQAAAQRAREGAAPVPAPATRAGTNTIIQRARERVISREPTRTPRTRTQTIEYDPLSSLAQNTEAKRANPPPTRTYYGGGQ